MFFNFLGIFFLFLFIFSSSVSATEEFETNYNVNYQVLTSGKARVTQEISLTNKFSHIYATQYSFILKGEAPENIEAFDEEGPLKTEIKEREKGETVIILTFNKQVVGKGKTLKFNLNFVAPRVAEKKGKIWEINLPRLGEEEKIDNYILTLIVPKEFGKPSYIKPSPEEQKEEENYYFFRFGKNQLGISGVSAAFGELQVFDFTLFYHLENPNSSLGETEIALPPDTAFQRVSYQKIEPKPLVVRVDNDGNWLAKYLLKPKEKITITAKGKVKIFNQPQENFPPPTKENLQNNLLPKKFWEADNPQILEKARLLKTPQAIYNFVVKNLNYDSQRAKQESERMGALKALSFPEKAICMEFTDLFVALCRAAGIPAREINGFAYTTDEKLMPTGLTVDVLHSWPEYYHQEKRVWLPVDPTWGKTTGGIDYFSKFDLNHFAFVIHGEDSQTPYPAGSYKTDGENLKNVYVAFGEYEEEKPADIGVNFQIPSQIYWGIKTPGKITVFNNGQTAVYPLTLKIEGSERIALTILSPFTPNLGIFPPFANKEIALEIKTKDFLKFSNERITVYLNEKEFIHHLKINFLPEKLVFPSLSGVFLFLLIFFLTKRKLCVKKK